jgi:hypothetical protein
MGRALQNSLTRRIPKEKAKLTNFKRRGLTTLSAHQQNIQNPRIMQVQVHY